MPCRPTDHDAGGPVARAAPTTLLAALASTTSLMVVAVLSSGACILGPGAPWGRASLSLDVEFAPPDDRTVELAGAELLATTAGYGVALAEISLQVGAVELAVVPAAPVETGHAHGEEEGDEPAGEVAVSAAVLELVRIEAGATRASAALGACSDDCELPRGELEHVAVDVGPELQLTGRVVDLASSRLPARGVAFVARVPVAAAYEAAVEGAVDRGAPIAVDVAAVLSLPATLLDDVDFAALPDEEAFKLLDADGAPLDVAQVAARLADEAMLVVAVTRPGAG